MIKAIIGLVVLVLIFVIGWTMEEPYPPEAFENGETHVWGLKFMKPCTPFGSDVSCGFDFILIIIIIILFIFILFDFII